MSYMRVIPRDLFNEANLLKCIGKLWILLEGRNDCCFEHDGEAFDIQQSEDDGSLSVTNIQFSVHGVEWILTRPLNSRRPWPLYATNLDKCIEVFTDAGELSEEFHNELKQLANAGLR